MSEEIKIVTVGQNVPNFELEIYDPKKNDFGKSLLPSTDLRKEHHY